MAERYHLPSVVISTMVCIMQMMSRRILAWKDFRIMMKEKRSRGKRKSYYGFEKLLYFNDAKRFQEIWENTNKSSLQKYTYVT